jgi:ankyrin repeat protein
MFHFTFCGNSSVLCASCLLKELLYLSTDDDSDDDEDDETDDSSLKAKDIPERKDDSSTDENDSTAAAHAAAIGHSPQPLKQPQSINLAPSSSLDNTSKENGSDSPEALSPVPNGVIVNGSIETRSSKVDADGKKNRSVDYFVDNSEEKKVEKTEDVPLSRETAALSSDLQPMESTEKNELESTKVDDSIPEKLPTINGTSVARLAGERKLSPKLKRQRIDPNMMVNERDDDENTPLHIAIHARKLEHVRILLEARASCRMKCDGSYPIHTAISIGSIRTHRQFAYDCFVLLHEYGADLASKDESIHTPLYLACMFNLPQIVSYILSYDDGLATLNTRADRAGNRPLHTAARFDTLENPSFSKAAAASATGHARVINHRPDGTSVSSMHPLPGFRGKVETVSQRKEGSTAESMTAAGGAPSTEALLTQLLLGTQGVEVDATNVVGQTPLHIACFRGNWSVARLLLQAGADPQVRDRRGYTPGHLAYKRAMPIPNDLVAILGDPPEKGIIPSLRDLIIDPHGATLLLSHELCILHRTCPPIRRDSPEPPPENVRRLQVLLDKETGILRSGEFANLTWLTDSRRAAISDVLKVR